MAQDIELVAASLRADAGDVGVYVEALARKLEQSFPNTSTIRRSGLRGKGPVRAITVAVGDSRFELEHRDGMVATRRSSVVRGITLKSEELSLDAWIDALASNLVEEAERSERGRQALENLLIGVPQEEAT